MILFRRNVSKFLMSKKITFNFCSQITKLNMKELRNKFDLLKHKITSFESYKGLD